MEQKSQQTTELLNHPITATTTSNAVTTNSTLSNNHRQNITTTMTKKDRKKRQALETKVMKITNKFCQDKDLHYKERLAKLQTNLTTMHQGNNPEYIRLVRDLEEERDLELIRLRYFEEYRVYRASLEFQQDIEHLKLEHENLITLCKKKLYQQLENKLQSLQEEKLLLDVANSHSYAMDYSRPITNFKNTRNSNSTASNFLGVNDNSGSASDFDNTNGDNNEVRLLAQINEGYSSGEKGVNINNTSTNNLSGNAWHDSSSTDDISSSSSAFNNGIGRRSLRRRVTTKQAALAADNNNSEDNRSTNHHINGTGKNHRNGGNNRHNNKNSDDTNKISEEWTKSLSEYSQLHALIFGTTDEDGNNNNHTHTNNKRKGFGRYSTKSAPPLQSLSRNEVTADINLIRSLTGQQPSPFSC
ncbi:Sds3p SCDLUD_002738 [Saccharomycodes ludwigii]|uniref:Sds3p n=1 Tax=Saccharomycodes ludwigii TaxID=36035 RepID=UPI001E8BFC3A|nr:hypothetical protein SCDLUD_002738 [Saccharomycodes ludwigii]KAH3901249.1 hypothetical protein SCDLUD_002738 [Saccharomycodes ludwigii]